jgi:Ca-activated chloride channel family protein
MPATPIGRTTERYTFRQLLRMSRNRILCCLLILTLAAPLRRSASQAPTYDLTVPVDEIVLTFHASDARGLLLSDLNLDDLHLLDNGQPPRRILSFSGSRDRPLRAGILLDSSESMTESKTDTAFSHRALAARYAQHLLQQPADQAFVMKFAFQSEIAQPWTNNPAAIATGLNRFVSVRSRPGTTVFDSIYRACLNQFGHTAPPDTANLILLFSDGEDNASRGTLKDTVDICQHTNTVIYAVRPLVQAGAPSADIATLADLTTQTGGRILYAGDSEAQVLSDLRTIEADLRNQYRLIYRPATLRHDGSFHRIDLTAPQRDATITVRSGYYASWR